MTSSFDNDNPYRTPRSTDRSQRSDSSHAGSQSLFSAFVGGSLAAGALIFLVDYLTGVLRYPPPSAMVWPAIVAGAGLAVSVFILGIGLLLGKQKTTRAGTLLVAATAVMYWITLAWAIPAEYGL